VPFVILDLDTVPFVILEDATVPFVILLPPSTLGKSHA
jgi:hypothetical protein